MEGFWDIFKADLSGLDPVAQALIHLARLFTFGVVGIALGAWFVWTKNRNDKTSNLSSYDITNGERREENRVIGRLEGLFESIQKSQDALWTKMDTLQAEMKELRSSLPGRVQTLYEGLDSEIDAMKTVVDAITNEEKRMSSLIRRIMQECPLFHKGDVAGDCPEGETKSQQRKAE